MPILFSIVAVAVYAPTISACGFSFLHILPTLVISCLFDNSHSDRYAVISHCSLDLHFPGDQCYWASFHVPVSHLYILFGKMSIQDLCPFKKVGLFVLHYEINYEETQRQCTDWEKIFVKNMFNEGLIFKIHEELV